MVCVFVCISMFPKIAVASKASDQINFTHNSDQIQRPNDLLTLQRFNKLVPIIGQEIRETKSSGAKQALMKLIVHSKILYFEIAAIRMQCIYRQHLAKERVKLIKHHVALFVAITTEFSERVVEEIVLAMSLECSLTLIRNHQRYVILKRVVENEMQSIAAQLIEDEVLESCGNVVIETITEATDYIAQRR